MEVQGKGKSKKEKNYLSTILYVAAAVVAIIGIALLVINIMLFRSTLSQYTAQGYPVDVVIKSLLPAQLLPVIFESIGMYGGIALVLFGIAKVNKKIPAIYQEENMECSFVDDNISFENTEELEAAVAETEQADI